LEEAVRLDTTFSRAWAELVIILTYLDLLGDHPEFTLAAEHALQRLQAVASGSANHLIAQAAYVYYTLKDYDHAHDIISQAVLMQPSDVRAIEIRSLIERRQGDFDAFLASREQARILDPRNPQWIDWVLRAQLMTHRYDELFAEVEDSLLPSFYTGYYKNLFRLRQDRDYKRFQNSTQTLCQSLKALVPDCEWEAHIANRDYQGALDSIQQTAPDSEGLASSTSERNRIFTYWLMQDEEALAHGLTRWKSQLEHDRDDSGDYRDARSYIATAMLSGIQGNANESEQLIQQWYRVYNVLITLT